MFGISGEQLVVLVAVALVVLGPERLPKYAQQLGRLVREVRRMASGAREQMERELGPEFKDVDWSKYDPRQYDPRRIVRDALSGDGDPAGDRSSRASGPAAASPAARTLAAGQAAPFDDEAT